MIDELSRTTLLVADRDEAVAFYVDVLGFEVVWTGEGTNGARTVHVGLPGQPTVGLWLVEATTDRQRALVGEQTGDVPAFVFYTDDCLGTYETLRERGVEFRGEPIPKDGSVVVEFEDCYGNVAVLVELTAASG